MSFLLFLVLPCPLFSFTNSLIPSLVLPVLPCLFPFLTTYLSPLAPLLFLPYNSLFPSLLLLILTCHCHCLFQTTYLSPFTPFHYLWVGVPSWPSLFLFNLLMLFATSCFHPCLLFSCSGFFIIFLTFLKLILLKTKNRLKTVWGLNKCHIIKKQTWPQAPESFN